MGLYWLIFGLTVLQTTHQILCQIVEFNSIEPKHTYTQASFSIVSGRNSSGHWNSKLHFSHTADKGLLDDEGNDTNSWKMDFDQKIEESEHGEKVHLYATVTIPPAVYSGVSTVSGEASAAFTGVDQLAEGYRLMGDLGYYKFHTEAVTWYTALMTCNEESAQLVVIKSEKEASVLRKLFHEYPSIPGAHYNYAAFIGVNDIEHEGFYVTIEDKPLQDVGYASWQHGQPNNYGFGDSPGQDCIAMNREALYLDVECYIKLPFICERSLRH